MKARKTHKRVLTAGYIDGDELALCGTTVVVGSLKAQYYRTTPKLARRWAAVTCKRCLQMREAWEA